MVDEWGLYQGPWGAVVVSGCHAMARCHGAGPYEPGLRSGLLTAHGRTSPRDSENDISQSKNFTY
jgi:hypothetical protein